MYLKRAKCAFKGLVVISTDFEVKAPELHSSGLEGMLHYQTGWAPHSTTQTDLPYPAHGKNRGETEAIYKMSRLRYRQRPRAEVAGR